MIYRVSQEFTTKTEDGKEVSRKSFTEYYAYGDPVNITAPKVG